MQTKDFDYYLPEELIASNPVSPRDSSKLMVLNRKNETITHHIFSDLPNIISEKYLMIFNDTKVYPGRLHILIDSKKGELLLLKRKSENIWECMVRPGKKFKKNIIFTILGKIETIKAKVLKINDDGTRLIEFLDIQSISNWISGNGYPPFPPYIKKTNATLEDYQTIYSRDVGSIAAPTAGLHFTDNVLKELKLKNIKQEYVTLHVGRGTFLPVKVENISNHKMHRELYSVSKHTADKLNIAKSLNKKILAVGTTSVRTLEANFNLSKFHHETKETEIFIYPGYQFKAVDAILTNFHLPKSTLLMLISAFAGKDFIMRAYEEAITKKYRFFSFGDSMLIL